MTLLRRSIAGLSLLLVAATLAGFLGDVWWGFDLAANLRPQYALVLILLAGGASLARWWDIAAVSLVGVAVNAAVIVPLFVDVPPPPATETERLHIMSLNVKISESEAPAVAEHIRDTSPDLVFFYSTTDSWAEAMRNADLPHEVLVSRPPGQDLEITVLSRDPALPWEIRRWGESNRSQAVQVTTQLGEGPVHVLGTHPVSPVGAERTARRNRLLRGVADWAAGEDDPVVIVGDLNATPWSQGLRTLLDEGGLTNSQRGYGVAATWPAMAGPLGIPIDHALLSPELTVVQRFLGPGFGSSHRALHVTVARAAPPAGDGDRS